MAVNHKGGGWRRIVITHAVCPQPTAPHLELSLRSDEKTHE